MCQCCVREERIRAEAHRKNKEYYMKAWVKRQNESKDNQNSQTLKSQLKVIVKELLRKATKAKAKKKA
jgi:hypothetical protein